MKTERIVFSADGVVKNIVKEQGDDSLISDSLPPLTFDDDMNTIPIEKVKAGKFSNTYAHSGSCGGCVSCDLH